MGTIDTATPENGVVTYVKDNRATNSTFMANMDHAVITAARSG